MIARFSLFALLTTFPAFSATTPCTKLTALAIPDVTVESAEFVSVIPPTNVSVPEFCLVRGVAHPTADSEIHIEVWLPKPEAWNGKLLGTGNGGYSSALSYRDMARGLSDGYVTAGHDTGHQGGDLRFGFGHPEKVVDFAYRSVHVMTTTAKLLVRAYLGRLPDESYFSSCSSGGHQALSEVQRYPADYDGVAAGAPANNRVHQTLAFLWNWQALHDENGVPLLNKAELKMLTTAAVKACGAEDGFVTDPRRCGFDPGALQCKGAATEHCLSERQVEAVRKVYAGAKNKRTGESLFAGWPKGSEFFGDSAIQSWSMYLLDPPEPMRADALRFFVFHDPNWDWRTFDWDRDVRYADEQLGFLSALDTNLSPFAKRGGKLIIYAGWSDPVVPAADTAQFYDAITHAMGGLTKTQQFARLFIAPGMGHCGGGPGPNEFDTLSALDTWVAKNVAPSQLLATHRTAGQVDRTRPLCPYPQVAIYKGTGGADKAENFVCGMAVHTSVSRVP